MQAFVGGASRWRPFAGLLCAGLWLAGCGTTPESGKALNEANRLMQKEQALKALVSYCEALQHFRREGMTRRVPLTLSAIYHRFHVLNAARLFQEAEDSDRIRLEPLRELLKDRAEPPDFLGLAFTTAAQQEQPAELGGPADALQWVGVERELTYAEYLMRCLVRFRASARQGGGPAPSGKAAAGRADREAFVEHLLLATLARLSCGFYGRAFESAERDKVDLLPAAWEQQAEAARIGREAAQALIALPDRTPDFRQLFEEEAELFAGVVEKISFRPGVSPGAYPVDPDLVVPQTEFNFSEGRARVALAVGELNAGNRARAQRYFLEGLRHLVAAGVYSDAVENPRPFPGVVRELVLEGEVGPLPGGARKLGPQEHSNLRTILDYLQSIFRNLERLSGGRS